MVFAAAIAGSMRPAAAETLTGSRTDIIRVDTGVNGANAVYGTPATAVQGTPGRSGSNLTIISTATVKDGEIRGGTFHPGKVTQVEVGSTGGVGGAGAIHWAPALAGGAGGDVSLNLQGSVDSVIFTPPALSTLVSVYSRGGQGGAAMVKFYQGTAYTQARRMLESNAGRGGDGSSVSAEIHTTLLTQLENHGVARVSSRGGNAGLNGRFSMDDSNDGRGGNAGPASLAIGSDASITTTGKSAYALIVESVGGNGSTATNGREARGGNGGDAFSGSRPSVSFQNAGSVSTDGDYALGVLLQSIGGTGGAGGINSTSAYGLAGGNGGAGGEIDGRNSSKISTKGQYAHGLVAQSVGGTGGAGGGGVVGGGNGGNAGNGGLVKIVNTGTITTDGAHANGIMAQSVGGGRAVLAFQASTVTPPTTSGEGGSGGFLFIGSGGNGGRGGSGGEVTVTNSGRIETREKYAEAIVAQSIGGGGGGGGEAQAYGLIFAVAQGGDGGAGGDGGKVTVTNLDPAASKPIALADLTTKDSRGLFAGAKGIFTVKDESAGIFAQSVGGGGGAGGAASARALGTVMTVATAVGGSGGSGGKGGDVEASNGLVIHTLGAMSAGIDAISIGGGGGAGGASYALAASAGVSGKLPNITVAVSVGGSGGSGGSGGVVKAVNTGVIRTEGADSRGILALSVGGGGGKGGLGEAETYTLQGPSLANVNATVGIGGTGGIAGAGGNVDITNTGVIQTLGAQSAGMAGYSIGGGGGVGGASKAATSLMGYSKAAAVNIAVGGKGGTGNSGGVVTLRNDGTISTEGDSAAGIHGLSVGGSGGAGGVSTIVSRTTASFSTNMAVNSTVGGTGGKASDGNRVDVKNYGTITTKGKGSQGVLVQSIGGGGGAGAAGGVASSNGMQMTSGVGGSGGAGGKGGIASTSNFGTISTDGYGAYAILVQSIGGGGGVGAVGTASSGDNPAVKALTSAGGAAGKAYLNKLISSWSSVLFGGTSGIGPVFNVNVPKSVAIVSSVGGTGGAAGDGGNGSVTNEGKLSTTGRLASALMVQSIGGGGGTGGAGSVSGGQLVNFKSSVGGAGGAGGIGGNVDVENTKVTTTVNGQAQTSLGEITTEGVGAFGIFAQSVGGGGGLGGISNDTSVTPDIPGLVLRTKAELIIGAQGASGDGGTVKVTNSGTIGTKGAQAHGIVAQSIGGGGGLVTLDGADYTSLVSAAAALSTSEKAALKVAGVDVDAITKFANDSIKLIGTQDATINVQLGGTGRATGSGNTVTVNQLGSITTEGANAFGIIAQSIGGGGGLVLAVADSNASKTTVTGRMGASVDSSGDGGIVQVNLGNDSKIKTTGIGSVGILAQSIGGGGGYTGALNSTSMNASTLSRGYNAPNGNGGAVSIVMNDPGAKMEIETSGKNAHGIFAQSIGGGGGVVANADGILLGSPGGLVNDTALRHGGAITINLSGAIKATGENAYAIYAQSGVQGSENGIFSSGLSGKIAVTFDGELTGGSGSGAAIRLDGGNGNTITLQKNAVVSAKSNRAITAPSAVVTNYGKLTGSNSIAGLENYGTYTSLAEGRSSMGALNNHGIFELAEAGKIGNTYLGGTYRQYADGQLRVDVSSGSALGKGRSDLLQTDKIRMEGGTIRTAVIGALRPETFTVISVPLNGGRAFDAMEFSADKVKGASATEGSPFSWTVAADDKNVTVTPKANFALPVGHIVSGNETNNMAYYNRIWDAAVASPSSMSQKNAETFGNFARSASADDFVNAVDSATPEEAASVASVQTMQAGASLGFSLSCPVFVGTGTLMEESSCVWARVIGDWTQQSNSGDADGYDGTAVTYRVGAQKEILDGWFLGATMGLTQSWLSDTEGYSSTDGIGMDASIALKRQIGPWLFAIAGHLGFGSYDTDRTLDIGPSLSTTSGTSSVLTAAARFRGSYEFAFANWYVKPYADVDVIYTYMPGYQENGLATSLNFSTASQWNLAISPNIEFGARYDLSPDMWLRPYGAIGMTFYTNDSIPIGVRLNDTVGVADLVMNVAMPSTLLNLTAGAQLFSTKGYELRGEYKANIGDDFLNQQLSARVAIPF